MPASTVRLLCAACHCGHHPMPVFLCLPEAFVRRCRALWRHTRLRRPRRAGRTDAMRRQRRHRAHRQSPWTPRRRAMRARMRGHQATRRRTQSPPTTPAALAAAHRPCARTTARSQSPCGPAAARSGWTGRPRRGARPAPHPGPRRTRSRFRRRRRWPRRRSPTRCTPCRSPAPARRGASQVCAEPACLALGHGVTPGTS